MYYVIRNSWPPNTDLATPSCLYPKLEALQARKAPGSAARPVQLQAVSVDVQGVTWLALSYIADLCRPVTSIGSRQTLIRYSWDLVVCSTVTHFGTRAFAVAGPKAWKQLPMHTRARALARSRQH